VDHLQQQLVLMVVAVMMKKMVQPWSLQLPVLVLTSNKNNRCCGIVIEMRDDTTILHGSDILQLLHFYCQQGRIKTVHILRRQYTVDCWFTRKIFNAVLVYSG
jgi:hypothetical protein